MDTDDDDEDTNTENQENFQYFDLFDMKQWWAWSLVMEYDCLHISRIKTTAHEVEVCILEEKSHILNIQFHFTNAEYFEMGKEFWCCFKHKKMQTLCATFRKL